MSNYLLQCQEVMKEDIKNGIKLVHVDVDQMQIKIYKNRIYTIFHYKKIPENIECFFSLSVTLLDSIVINTDKKSYPQMFLEECKYALEKKKMMDTVNE